MSVVAASAPGKVVLSGEYAVLDDAPAVAMAVDRRALASYSTTGSGITCLGAATDGDTRLFERVAEAAGYGGSDRGDFTLDTRAFVATDGKRKLGIGSSAALSVALAAVLGRLSGGDARADTVAYTAHNRFQAKTGSGVDIATSYAGGLIEYCRPGRTVTRLVWPQGLHFRLVWTGIEASTGGMLSKLDLESADFSELGEAAGETARAWSSGDVAGILTATTSYTRALADFDRQHGIGIMGGGHEGLVAAAATGDIVYKPCGAGGGDIGIVLGADRGEVDAFVVAAAERGCRNVSAVLDTCGLAVSGVPL